jgi:phosphate:Na+ symporter
LIDLLSLFAVFLAIFLYGMTILRTGLYQLSHNKMESYLSKLTDSPWKGLLIGTVVTAIMQSSSAVMVITIGLVSAGMLTFRQTIGIILGANIGTTFTTEWMTLDLGYLVLPLLLLGALLLVTKHVTTFSIGACLFGLGCIFTAMNGFENLAKPLASFPIISSLFTLTNEHELIGIGFGAVLTAIIQSSTATTGITMGLLNEDLLTLSASTAIILGANIGTCLTAYIASIGGGREARLSAFAHIWLNIFGVVLFIPFIHLLGKVAIAFTSLPDVQLAHISLIFNISSSLLALPLAGILATFIIKVHGKTV